MFENKYEYQSDFAGYTREATGAKPVRHMPTSIWAGPEQGSTQAGICHSRSRVSSRMVICSGNAQDVRTINTQIDEVKVSRPAGVREHDWNLPDGCNQPALGSRPADNCAVHVTSSQFSFNFHIAGLHGHSSIVSPPHFHATVPTYNDLRISRKRPLSNSCIDGRPQADPTRQRRPRTITQIRSQLIRTVTREDDDPMDIDSTSLATAQKSQ